MAISEQKRSEFDGRIREMEQSLAYGRKVMNGIDKALTDQIVNIFGSIRIPSREGAFDPNFNEPNNMSSELVMLLANIAKSLPPAIQPLTDLGAEVERFLAAPPYFHLSDSRVSEILKEAARRSR